MKFLFALLLVPLLIIPAFAESQTLPTEKGTLDIKLTYDVIEQNIQTKINIDFINPFTQKIQVHIDYTVAVSKDGETVFGPTQLIHTSEGSVKIPIDFNLGEGVYSMDVGVEGILFQPIPPETASFKLQLGEGEVESQKIDTETKAMPSETTSKTNIPNWIKQVAEFWIVDQIDDRGFVQVIEYLVQQDIITIPYAEAPKGDTAVSIPSWIKTNAEFWVKGNISDDEFAIGLEWLINNGIITVS